jgi:hypothetical protein
MKTKEASTMASLALGEPKDATVFFFERQIRPPYNPKHTPTNASEFRQFSGSSFPPPPKAPGHVKSVERAVTIGERVHLDFKTR